MEAAKERGRERGSMVAYVFARGLWEGVLAGLPGLILVAGGLRHRGGALWWVNHVRSGEMIHSGALTALRKAIQRF